MSSPSEIWSHRTLLANLVQRDLKSKYKKSVLGWSWSLLSPAANLAVYTLVFGAILRGEAPVAGDGETQVFALYLFAGLVAWNTFYGAFNASMESFAGAGPLLTKIYFPPECPALAATAGVLLQAAIESTILCLILAALGNYSWTMLLLPLVVVQIAVFAVGLGLVAGLLNVQFRDVSYLSTIALQMGFYATPIVYSMDLVPETVYGWIPARTLLEINPTTQFAAEFRALAYHLELPSLGTVVYATVVSVVSLLVGWAIFARQAPRVIEEL